MAMSEGYAGADEEPDKSDDDGETTADKFEKLRKLKGAALTEEIRKYVNDAGEFSLLKPWTKTATSSSRLSFSVGAL